MKLRCVHALARCAIALNGAALLVGGFGWTTLHAQTHNAAQAPLVKVADYQMREGRFGPAAVADGDFIYIIGGSNSGTVALDTIERFNVRTGQSEDFAKLAVGRYWSGAVIYEHKIYVLGGSNGNRQAPLTNPEASPAGTSARPTRTINSVPEGRVSELSIEASVEVVDLATRKVSFGVPMPDARTQFACVQYGGKIYVVGGKRMHGNAISRTNTMAIFDLATGTWSTGVPMPTPRESVAALVDGGFIILPGGYNGTRELTEVEVFNPRESTWRSLPPLLHPVGSHSLVFLGHQLFLFGDYESPDKFVAYDLITKQSQSFTLNYKSARHTAAVVQDGKIYVIGGKASSEPDSEALNYIQVYTLSTNR
jgi:hypothetical protein